MRTIRRLFFLLVLVVAYGAGDFLGLPQPVRDGVRAVGGALRSAVDENSGEIVSQAQEQAERARQWIAEGGWDVPDEESPAPVTAEAPPPVAPAEPAASAPSGAPDLSRQPQGAWTATAASAALYLCPRTNVQNAPPSDADGKVRGLPAYVRAGQGARIATVPVQGSCLASGFGTRGGKLHKGVDYHHKVGVLVHAAAGGTVREALYRSDYGNLVVIDHGQGAFTRYAHLATIAGGVRAGAAVAEGDRIGVMGRTAGYSVPIHLHYEILTGEWAERAGSFALDPQDPFALPPA